MGGYCVSIKCLNSIRILSGIGNPMGPVSPWCCNQCPKRTNERSNGRRRNSTGIGKRIGTKKASTSSSAKQRKCHGNREEFPAADQEPPKRYFFLIQQDTKRSAKKADTASRRYRAKKKGTTTGWNKRR